MPDSAPPADHREIPFNYTSADDQQVVRFLFGADVWRSLEEIRSTRVTGRSARLLMRLMGDLFLLRRNPFLYEQLVEAPARRARLLGTIAQELDVIAGAAAGESRVLDITERCREYVRDLSRDFQTTTRRRARIRRALGAVVGEDRVHFDAFSLISHATDATDWRLHLPLAVVRPSREEEVAPLLRALHRLGLPAIPRGAGTGLTGGAVPLRPGCVMINLEALDRLRGIRVDPLPATTGEGPPAPTLEVEAGVVTEDAMVAAQQAGLVFATDPTSAWACTIGGNIAENAGGKSAVLWGTALDNLISYRQVLPNGTVCTVTRLDHPRRKVRAGDRVCFEVSTDDGQPAQRIDLPAEDIRKPGLGKDVTNKALGGLPGLQKEGTDGVITSARFLLHPAYAFKKTCCLEFFGEDLEEASRVIVQLSEEFVDQGEEALLALEHFDEQYVRAIGYRTKAPRQQRPQAVLLIDMVAHDDGQLARGVGRLIALLQPFADTEAFFADDDAEGARFWQDRKQMGAIARHTNAFKLNEDIVLPLGALATFARFVDQLNAEEERCTELAFVAAAEAELGRVGNRPEGRWLGTKLPPALARCAAVRERLAAAGPAELRGQDLATGLRDDLLDLFRGYDAICAALTEHEARIRARRIAVATHMHAGDGNVHVNIPVFSNDREMMTRAMRAADRTMEQAVALGGVVTGEHGIGITKLRHLDAERREALRVYRQRIDPDELFNPGKLSDLEVLDTVFTPSFNLLGLEAAILQHHKLRELADKISKCVRCGKCKPDCCVFFPAQQLFYHPRNKNLAVAALIEALLYQAQRFQSTRFESLRQLEEVADHCTICHKCQKPCPVKIDTGEVSVLERQILTARRYKHTALATRASLRYLVSRGWLYNTFFRLFVLRIGSAVQRLLAGAIRLVGGLGSLAARWPLSLLRSPLPRLGASPLFARLPRCLPNQAVLLEPEGEARRTVFYFPGCGSERLFSSISQAAIYLLLRTGSRVVLPPPYLCCGFPLEANAKTVDHAGKRLSATIIFNQIREMLKYLDFDAVAVSCGTCREALRSMDVERIFGCGLTDVSELALRSGLEVPEGDACLYHRPCHDSLEGRAEALFAERGLAPLVAVPHCCSEAGTLALSRPDIAHKMLVRKGEAVRSQLPQAPRGAPILTNCPTCLQGLGRNASLGAPPRHLAEELARRAGGARWQRELQGWLDRAQLVNF